VGYLIDTCIWVDVEQGRLAPGDIAEITGSEPVYLSPVTIAELKLGAEVAEPALRQKRLAALERLRAKPILPIDATSGVVFGDLAAQLKRGGRGHRSRVQDLWIASQAIQHNLTLLTRNVADFADIPGLDLVTLTDRA
jgi:predicted nucleic acid-binding protein